MIVPRAERLSRVDRSQARDSEAFYDQVSQWSEASKASVAKWMRPEDQLDTVEQDECNESRTNVEYAKLFEVSEVRRSKEHSVMSEVSVVECSERRELKSVTE